MQRQVPPSSWTLQRWTELRVDKAEYWRTRAGLLERTRMLSQRAVYGLYNEYIKAEAKVYGARRIVYHILDERACDDCMQFAGREYNLGQFLPYIPRHPNCRCWWEPVWEEAPPYVV